MNTKLGKASTQRYISSNNECYPLVKHSCIL